MAVAVDPMAAVVATVAAVTLLVVEATVADIVAVVVLAIARTKATRLNKEQTSVVLACKL